MNKEKLDNLASSPDPSGSKEEGKNIEQEVPAVDKPVEEAGPLEVEKEEPKPAEAVEEEPKPAEAVEEEPKPAEAAVEEEKPEQKEERPLEEAPSEEPKEEEPKPAEAVVEEEKTEETAPKGEKRWYVIQALTGHENKVKRAIEFTIASKNLKDKVAQVLVPTEEIIEIKGGKRVEKVKHMFPGYVFLEMILDDESWYLIRQTPGVARFIGTKVRPTPVSEREMQRVLKQLGKAERLEITFEKGEGVRVISGPFRGYTGTVDEINPEKGKLKILINIFGRDTPVEVNLEHAQKIE